MRSESMHKHSSDRASILRCSFLFTAIRNANSLIHCLCLTLTRKITYAVKHVVASTIDKWAPVDWVLISAFYKHAYCRWNGHPFVGILINAIHCHYFGAIFVQSTEIIQINGSQTEICSPNWQRKRGKKKPFHQHYWWIIRSKTINGFFICLRISIWYRFNKQ